MQIVIDIDEESYEHIKAYANEEVLPIGWYSIINGTPLPKGHDLAIKTGMKAIEQTTWHSVYDELPTKFGTYIVTAYDGHMYRTSFAKYQSKLKSWILTGQMSHWRIVAWQPLPEPYQVESEDKE